MQKESGFTLIELIVTLAVAGILTAVAVPSFKTTIMNNRLVTQSNDLLAAMLYARTQAISSGSTQGQNVTVCASSNTTSATPTCNSTNWANGWIVTGYTSAPTGAPGTATNLGTPTATVIRVYPGLPTGTTLDSNAYGSSVAFTGNGSLGTAITGSSYFILCDSRGVTYGRAIYLGASGEARVSTTPGKLLDGSTAITSCTQ
jgi:type IV fimbrial biogenesis protein FimT